MAAGAGFGDHGSGSVSGSEQHVTKWYIPKCPLEHECSTASWGRVRRCASWTGPDECKEFLRGHLKNSYLHSQNDLRAINEVVDLVEVVEELLPAHWFDNPNDDDDDDDNLRQHRPPKRQRATREGDVPQTKGNTAGKAHSELALQYRPSVKSRPACPSSSSSSTSSEVMMTISRQDLVKAVAAVDRARDATEHAMKLAAGAEAAFRCEAAALGHLRGELSKHL